MDLGAIQSYVPQLHQSCRFYSDNGQTTAFFMDKSYNYGPLHQNNGNVMSITNNKDGNRTQTFTYDLLNRITAGWTTANTGSLSWGETYSVDAWGNLQMAPMGGKAQGGNFQHAGDVMNHAASLGYDAAGNLTNYSAPNQYVYDAENRIQSTAGVTYTYDADGNRVKKSGGTTNTIYWYGAPGIIAETDLSGTLKSEYVFLNGRRVARIDSPGNTVHYYLSDHLNSTSMVISASGTPEEESDYSPFGTEYKIISGSNHYKFTGKERDTESCAASTCLDYFGARYYANAMGRFITPDWAEKAVDVPYAEFSDPQSLNLYSYVRNVPTTRADLDGHCWPISDCAHIVMNKVDAVQATLQSKAERAGPTVAAITTFTTGSTRDVINGFVGLGTVGEASGAAWNGSTTDRVIAAAEDGGKVGGIILAVVAVAGPKAPASAESGAQVASEIGRNRVTLDNGSQVDLAGKTHFEKSTGQPVPTPHIKDPAFNTNPATGQTFQNGYGPVRPATIGDVNAAANASGAQPPITIPKTMPVPVGAERQR